MERIIITIRRIIFQIIAFIIRTITPINRNKIVFLESMYFSYSESPRYICECLMENKQLKIIWLVKDLNTPLPVGVKAVKYRSLTSLFELASAKVKIYDDRNGHQIRKKRRQIFLYTNHATAQIKKVEGDILDKISLKHQKLSRYDGKVCNAIISSNTHQSEYYRNYYFLSDKCNILEFGSPRNDILLNKKNDAPYINELKKEYGVPLDAYLVLWAPTFRTHIPVPSIDFENVIKILEKRLNQKVIILSRLHPNNKLNTSKSLDLSHDGVIDISYIKNPNDVVLMSNLCISDYSSIAFDCNLIDKPFLLFVPDESGYTNERGMTDLYYSIKNEKCYSQQDLLDKLLTIPLFDYKTEYLHYFDTGMASKLVAEYIVGNMYKNKKKKRSTIRKICSLLFGLKKYITIRFNHKKLIKNHYVQFRLNNVSNIKPFVLNHWGVWNDNNEFTYRFFYKGKYQGKTIFLKVGNDDTLRNEYYISDFINNIADSHIQKSLHKIKVGSSFAIFYKLIEVTKISSDVSIELFKKICRNGAKAIESLNEMNIYHCDISRNNFVLSSNDVIVIDYGCSYYLNASWRGIDYKEHPCSNKITNNDGTTSFDDFQSFYVMLKSLNLPVYYYSLPEFDIVVKNVGKYVVSIEK